MVEGAVTKRRAFDRRTVLRDPPATLRPLTVQVVTTAAGAQGNETPKVQPWNEITHCTVTRPCKCFCRIACRLSYLTTEQKVMRELDVSASIASIADEVHSALPPNLRQAAPASNRLRLSVQY